MNTLLYDELTSKYTIKSTNRRITLDINNYFVIKRNKILKINLYKLVDPLYILSLISMKCIQLI